MPISLANYVAITSGIGGASVVANRQLGGMLITENNLCPTGTVLTFTSADDVGTYFGFSSTEYLRALFYFSWVSKNITAPGQLSFYFWPVAATASLIFGKPAVYVLGSFTSIANGDFTLTMGGHPAHIVGIDFSADASLAAVAATLQTAIRAAAGAPANFTGATVTYDVTRGCFDLVSGATGADVITVAAGVTNDVAGPLGWLTGAILSNGAALQSISANLASLIQISNNFGSFAYVPVLNQAQIVEASNWNNGTNPNIMFMYTAPVTAATAAAIAAATADIGGVTLTLAPLSNEYPEMCPMMILGATDYNAVNSVQNYEFQIFALTPSVNTDADKALYDGLNINYYGQTQTAGQLIQFYQEGVMQGLPVNPSDQNVYANEIWFKDAAGAQLMNLLLVLSQLPANNAGKARILSALQSVIQLALNNGTISVGKPLNITQQLFIGQITNDPNAWQQVQNNGYWVGCTLTSAVVDGKTKWTANYTLVYSKDDVIRKIVGRDILI